MSDPKNISWEPINNPLIEPKPVDVIWTPIQPEHPSALKEGLFRILHNLPPNTPDSFRKGAERAALLLIDLEEGKSVTDREFLAGIQQSFIFPAKVLSQALQNAIAMPTWVDQLPIGIPQLGIEEQKRAAIDLEILGERLMKKTGGKKHLPQSGAAIGQTYLVLKESKTVPGSAFKLYIEGISQLNQNGLSRLFDRAIESGIAPDEIKYHEGNTVLYWKNEKKEVVDRFVALCIERRIEARGPASDVFIIKGIHENTLDFKVISNDQVGASVTSGFEWREEHYSPERFFKQWIQLCFAFGRRPDVAGFSAFLIAETPENADPDYATRVQSAYVGSLPIMFLEKGNRAATKTNCFA